MNAFPPTADISSLPTDGTEWKFHKTNKDSIPPQGRHEHPFSVVMWTSEQFCVHRNYYVSTQVIIQIAPVIVKEFDFFAFEETAIFHMFPALVLGSHSLTSDYFKRIILKPVRNIQNRDEILIA